MHDLQQQHQQQNFILAQQQPPPFLPNHGLTQGDQQYAHTKKHTENVDVKPFIHPHGSTYGAPVGCGLVGAPQASAIQDLADVTADTIDKPGKINRKGNGDLPKSGATWKHI